jgi:hypothetical protein
MLQSRGKTLVLCPTIALIATFLAACDSTVGPDLAGPGETLMCETNSYDEPVCYPIDPVVEARPVFSSMDEFEANLQPLQDASTAELIALEQMRVGQFESLRAYLDPNEDTEEAAAANAGTDGPTGNEARALQNDGVTREDFPLSDAFLSLLNSRGEVQIGESVFKVTRDHVYEVAADYASVLSEKVPTLSSPPPADGDPAITAHEVETTETEVIEEPAPSRLPATGGASLNVEYVTSGNVRLRAISYVTNAWFYSEMGVNTTWQRRKSFLFVSWWANTWQPGTLSHSYNATYRVTLFPSNTYSVSGTQSVTGTGQIHKTLMWRVGLSPATTFINGSGNTTHTVSNPSMNRTVGTHF